MRHFLNLQSTRNNRSAWCLSGFFRLAAFHLLLTSLLQAAALKKVLILDVVNIDKNANYDYLVGSITDAFTAKLKENFAYSETPKEAWQKAAVAGDLPNRRKSERPAV